MKKRPKFIIAIYLFVQSLAFFIAFLCTAKKQQKLSTVFAVIAGAGTIGGAAMLYLDQKECQKTFEEPDFDEIDEDFCDLDADEDDIVCSFDEETPEENA